MKKHKLNTSVLYESRIPKKFWGLGIDTYFGDSSALKQVIKYVEHFDEALKDGIGLFISGPTQSCKTFLATFVLKTLLHKDVDVVYYSLDELFELYVSGESAGDRFLEILNQRECIVFDNIGISDKVKLGKRNALEKAIVSRSDNGLPYIVCTTLELGQEIVDNYGGKLSSCFDLDLIHVKCYSVYEKSKALRTSAKQKLIC